MSSLSSSRARKIDELPDTITAPRTDPIYNCHSYLTKVPVGAIKPFIETFSAPGEVIVDFFAGSGMTGLAALIAGRSAKLSDISALGQHIAKGYVAYVTAHTLRAAAEDVVRHARVALGDWYTATRQSDGTKHEVVRTVWSFAYACPSCATELVYFYHLDAKGRAPEHCPACTHPFVRREWKRAADVPVEVVLDGENGKQASQPVTEEDLRHIADAASDPRQSRIPSLSIDQSREMYGRSGLGKSGMTETKMFFSSRNAIALLELWNNINAVEEQGVRKKLQFAFTAILPRASKRYQWSPKRPLNAQNQTYYIAPVYYEWNVFELFMRKVEASIRAADILYPEGLFRTDDSRQLSYELASANRLAHLESASIDYVFTDPPFGSNIFYSDMNLFQEAWLGTVTNHEAEAVVHTSGSRKSGAEARYEALLRDAFNEAWRVLKPGRHMSVVFGNSSGRIWGLVQRALRDAGFNATPVHVAILDKGQRSVKGLNSGSEGVVTVDLVITVQKPPDGEVKDDGQPLRNGDAGELIAAAIHELHGADARNPSHVYARVLRKAIERHFVLDDLHHGDILIALRNAGYVIDRKSGLLMLGADAESLAVA